MTISERKRPRVAVVWRVLGHVGCRATVLAAQRETLDQAQRDQDDRRRDADRFVRRKKADDEGRHTHQQDRDQEGVLAPDQIADAAEDDGAEGSYRKAGRERQQRKQELRGWIQTRKELLADDRGERAVKIKVIPLEYRAQ